jgi:hypothetical protein
MSHGPAAPHHQVRVAGGAVGVGDEGVEPDEARGEVGVDQLPGGERVEVERALQVAQRHVGPGALAQEVLDLGVALGAPELVGQLERGERGTGKPSAAASPPTTSSAMSTRAPWPGAAELRHPEPAVVALDHGRQRARPRAAAARSARR